MPRITAARREEKRAHILAAAEACFSRLGFRQATMRDVIAEAGVSAGGVYTHFASKDEIISQIISERHAAEARRFQAAAADDDPVGALRALAQGFLRELDTKSGRDARRVGVQTWAEALLDPSVLNQVSGGFKQALDHVSGIIERGQAAHQLAASIDAQVFARALISLYHGFVLQKLWDADIRTEDCLAALDAMLAAITI